MTTIKRFAFPALLAATTAFAGLTVLAQAPQPPDAPSKPARTMDVELIKARGAAVFKTTDVDGNNAISRAEFAAAKPAHPQGKRRGHHRMDPGMHPGKEHSPEMNANLFKALDADASGQVSAAEFEQIGSKMREMHRNAAFDRMDTNEDGVLDSSEYPPFIKRVEALDTDGDGTVTPEERRAARAKQPAKS